MIVIEVFCCVAVLSLSVSDFRAARVRIVMPSVDIHVCFFLFRVVRCSSLGQIHCMSR